MSKLDYKETIDTLVDKFKSSNTEHEENLCNGLENYLYFVAETLENSTSKFIDRNKTSIEVVLKRRTDDLISADMQMKQQLLLKDEKYEEIEEISRLAFFDASRIAEGEIKTVDYDVNEKIKRINELFEEVQSYNKERARMIVSETLLDLQFIGNPEIKFCSLRLGHFIRMLKEQKQNNNKEER